MTKRKAPVRDLGEYRRFRRILEAGKLGGWNVRPGSEAGIAEEMTYMYLYDLATGNLISGGLPARAFQDTAMVDTGLAPEALVTMVTGLLRDVFDDPRRARSELGRDPQEAALQAATMYFTTTEAWKRSPATAGLHVFVLYYRRKHKKAGGLRPFALRARAVEGLLPLESVHRAISDVVNRDRARNPTFFPEKDETVVIPFPGRDN